VAIGSVPSENSVTTHTYTYTDNAAHNGTTYTYGLRIVNSNNDVTETNRTVTATPSFSSAVVTEYALLQNFPNPFNPETQIAYDLVEAGNVTLTVYNLMGQEVALLVNGMRDAGRHAITFNASNLPSGLYLYKLEVNGFSATHKMMLMK